MKFKEIDRNYSYFGAFDKNKYLLDLKLYKVFNKTKQKSPIIWLKH